MTTHFLFYPVEFSVSCKACFKDGGFLPNQRALFSLVQSKLYLLRSLRRLVVNTKKTKTDLGDKSVYGKSICFQGHRFEVMKMINN